MSNRTTILTMGGVAAIMLVIGVAIGSVAFPTTKTITSTSTLFPKTVTATEVEVATNSSTYQVITIVKEYVVSPVAVATAYQYGTCSAGYGTLNIVESTVSTVYSEYGGIGQNAQHVLATVTTTTSSPLTFEGATSTNVTTISIDTTVSPCPIFV